MTLITADGTFIDGQHAQVETMQRRLTDCFRQQRFPYPGYASDVTIALASYMGVNAKGAKSIAPSIKR